MDFDRYFVIHEQDWQDIDGTSSDWEDLGASNHETSQTCRIQICIEDRLTDYISNLYPDRHQTHMEEHVTKPLPPVPEEHEAGSLPALASRNAARLRRRPTVSKTTNASSDERPTSSYNSSTAERPVSPFNDRRLSLWPRAHASDMRKAAQTSAITLQRHIDGSYHPNFESLDSKESSDLDQWANEVYGPQDSPMTALRRGEFPNIPTMEHQRAPTPISTRNIIRKQYHDSTYCSSISTGSYTDHERHSSYSTTDGYHDYIERGKSEDTNATSFFDTSDDDEQESEYTLEKRNLAKKFWQRMASSLRPTKSSASMRRTDMPELDLRPARSNTSMRRSRMPSIDLRPVKSSLSIRRSGIPPNDLPPSLREACRREQAIGRNWQMQ